MSPDEIEQHRHECEVRDIAGRPLHQRRMILAEIDRARGADAGNRIRRDLQCLWERREALKKPLNHGDGYAGMSDQKPAVFENIGENERGSK